MDIKTLLIAALAVAFSTNLCMVIIFWTRRTYAGFGYWVAGNFCLMASVPLFILPRDHFPPWLTIILANYLWFVSAMLNNRGNLVFRSRRISYGWEIAASVSFCALFAYFTYVEPNVAARVTVIVLYHGGFQLWTITVLLIRCPAYFGSSDVLQVVSLGILVAIHTMRAVQTWILVGSFPHQVVALQPFVDMVILAVMMDMLLVALSQIMMNAQRLEYDYRLTQGRLKEDIIERHRLEEALREQAIRDPLTGLFNRRYLDETLPRELHRCQRNDEPLAVAMLDIDHFKHFNDDYGHDTGDTVLRAMGDLLKGFLRVDDIACRYGGEEFTVILPGSTLNDALIRLDSLRCAIMQLRVVCKEDDLPAITVSIGVAAAGEQEVDAIALLARADAALYQAKAGGRNQVK